MKLFTRDGHKNPHFISFERGLEWHKIPYCYFDVPGSSYFPYHGRKRIYRVVIKDWYIGYLGCRFSWYRANIFTYDDEKYVKGKEMFYYDFNDKDFEKMILEYDDWKIGYHPLVEGI